jgi:hypothetical protein
MTPQDLQETIGAQVNGLKPGECININTREFFDAFQDRSLYGDAGRGMDGAISVFLSKCMGSAYGYVRAEARQDRPVVTISRHEGDPQASHQGFLHHVDADRKWMFDRVPGGWQRKAGT